MVNQLVDAGLLKRVKAPAFSIRPGQLVLRRLLSTRPDLAEEADHTYQLHPAETIHAPPAWFDPSDMDRVVGFGDTGCDRERELARIQGGERTAWPTRMYRLRDVQLLRGNLFTPRMFHLLDPKASIPWVTAATQHECAVGALAGSRYGLTYFGHWLHNDLAMCLAAESMGPLVTPQVKPFSHQAGYLEATALQTTHCSAVTFKELYYVDDTHAENSHKRDRLFEIRRRIWSAHPTAPHPGVFLVRGNTGQRRVLINEMDLAESLATRGIRVLNVNDLTAQDLMRQCANARVVIGVEGSQLAHGLISMADQGSMLVIQPPQRFNCAHKEICDVMGARYGFVVGERIDNSGDFRVDVNRVNRLLDRLTPH